MKESFAGAMESLQRAYGEVPWGTTASFVEAERPVVRWVEAVYEARRLAKDEDLDQLVAFARATAAEVASGSYLLFGAVRRAREVMERLELHGDWERYCRLRSGIEIVRDLYHGLAEGPGPFEAPGVETENLDDLAESFGRDYGYLYESEIPSFIPVSHWWWWAPDPPPSARS